MDHSQKYIEIGYNIAYYRKHAGITQEQLAEKVGISRAHPGAIEAPHPLMRLSRPRLPSSSIRSVTSQRSSPICRGASRDGSSDSYLLIKQICYYSI